MFWGWILVYSNEDSRSTKFIQMFTVSDLWPFYDKVKLGSLCICTGKMLKSNFLKMYERLMAETYNVWLK